MQLIIVPVGTMAPFLLEDKPFKTGKGLVDYVLDRELDERARLAFGGLSW